MPSPRIALIGAGDHASKFHLPALAHLASQLNGPRVTVVCDQDLARATAAATPWGARVTTDWRECFSDVDGVVACVPPGLTPAVARYAQERGVPILMEKPLAPDLAGAEALTSLLTGASAMVSLNRRFEPVVTQALAWLNGRTIQSVRGCMARVDRRERDFLSVTGIHMVDMAVAVVGAPVDTGRRLAIPGGDRIAWTTAADIPVAIEILPTSGFNEESLTCSGADWAIELRSAFFDAGWTELREDGKSPVRITVDPGLPAGDRCGTLAETVAFLAAIAGQGRWWPTPADALPATRLCHLPLP